MIEFVDGPDVSIDMTGPVISSPADLAINCQCGDELRGGGLASIHLQLARIWIKEHEQQGHAVTITDPRGLLKPQS